MLNTYPADPRATHVQNFCACIVPNGAAITMPIYPEAKSQPMDCFENVRRKIQQSGGRIQFGWSIWEWPNVYIEAEHHAVYENTDGLMIDITPSSDGKDFSRTFLPDSSAVYDFENEGVRSDNHRLALSDDPQIEAFFETARAFNREMNKIPGVGEVSIDLVTARKLESIRAENARLLHGLLMKHTPQGALCFCGSGQKFKRCHGKR